MCACACVCVSMNQGYPPCVNSDKDLRRACEEGGANEKGSSNDAVRPLDASKIKLIFFSFFFLGVCLRLYNFSQSAHTLGHPTCVANKQMCLPVR